MTHPFNAASAAARANLHCLLRGLPDDVKALKALLIDLHARALELERYIALQRAELRRISPNVEALRKVTCAHHANHRFSGDQDEARLIHHGDNGSYGSGF